MIEQTVEEVAESMKEDPEEWAKLYLESVALTNRLLQQLERYSVQATKGVTIN